MINSIKFSIKEGSPRLNYIPSSIDGLKDDYSLTIDYQLASFTVYYDFFIVEGRKEVFKIETICPFKLIEEKSKAIDVYDCVSMCDSAIRVVLDYLELQYFPQKNCKLLIPLLRRPSYKELGEQLIKMFNELKF